MVFLDAAMLQLSPIKAHLVQLATASTHNIIVLSDRQDAFWRYVRIKSVHLNRTGKGGTAPGDGES